MIDRVIISPELNKTISIAEMELIFDLAGAQYETIFRRLEFNQIIGYTRGTGIDYGCGLNKIHSWAIGLDFQRGNKDLGYAFGANIKIDREKHALKMSWFNDGCLDFVFSSHCLEHFAKPEEIVIELLRVLKPGGKLIIILPHMEHYPRKGGPNANKDHEWDCYPDSFVKMVKDACPVEVLQLDTLHDKLAYVELTVRDKKIANHYNHKSLNFSFEAVFKKLPY